MSHSATTASSVSSTPLRVLLLLGQSPFDPTSGAAQSMRQIAQLLARSGVEVRALSTTGCEGDVPEDHTMLLHTLGAEFTTVAATATSPVVLTGTYAGIGFELLTVKPERRHSWEHDIGRAYHERLDIITQEWRPNLVFTFGEDPTDLARRRSLRASGARVVFALHNLHYARRRTPEEVDAFLAPTHFLAARYRGAWGRRIEVLPPPLDPDHIVSRHPEPVCIGFCNPEPAKGAALIAHLAARLGRERPEVPLLIIGGRASGADFLSLGRRLGHDLSAFPNLLQTTASARVADVWGACRILLMPSIVEEAAGRVALEAMANGSIVIASDRGGLPELVSSSGVVLPLPASLTLRTAETISPELIDQWWYTLIRALDDEIWFQTQSANARKRAESFLFPALQQRYFDWFQQIAFAGKS